MILLVAATDIELCDHEGLVCGVGPVEAATATARHLALEPARRGSPRRDRGRAEGSRPGGLVIGSESVYCDIAAEIPVVDRVEPDAGLLEVVRGALPDALVLPIGTSAAVGGASDVRVEGMEGFGVLRACALAGVPAVEIRAISNEISEGDRSRWRIGRALEALADAIPRVLEAAAQ